MRIDGVDVVLGEQAPRQGVAVLEWPLASEPVGDDYTPARPDDVWFEEGCRHWEQQRGIRMCADDGPGDAGEVAPFGTNAAFLRGGSMVPRGELDSNVGTRDRWNPPH